MLCGGAGGIPPNDLFWQLVKPPALTKNEFRGREIENPRRCCHSQHLPRHTSWASFIMGLPLCSSTLPHVSCPFETEPTLFNKYNPESIPFATDKKTSERRLETIKTQ